MMPGLLSSCPGSPLQGICPPPPGPRPPLGKGEILPDRTEDYMHVQYFRKCIGTRVSEMMFRQYIGNQRPKKSQLSGRQTFTRKNFPDEVRKLFSRQKCGKSA